MPDDDSIQYLGMRPATRTLPILPFLSSSQRPVTGVALCIEKSDTEPEHNMTFRKADGPMVHIGRRPGSDGDKGRAEPGKAFFNCPVVSRRHAKIAFTDSGHCYIIDSHSHHGTHVRKAGDAVSKPLTPETPTLLADGDILTFGKSVGSDKGLVRPVVARVDLLYGVQPPLKPLVVPGTPEGQQKSILRTPSGRYGVYVPVSSEGSSSSDEGAASPDSHDSDIEEISKPAPSVVRLPWLDGSSSSESSSPSPGAGQKKVPESSFSFVRQFSPFGISDEPRAFSPGPTELAPLLFDRPSMFYNASDAYNNHDDDNMFEEDDDHDDNSDDGSYSRSDSPMDLSSSPEPSDPPDGVNRDAVGEPVVVGAWPHSRSSSPVSVFSSSFPPVRIAPSVEERTPSKPAVIVFTNGDDDSDDEAPLGAAPKVDSEKVADIAETAQLKESLATVQAEVTKLHAHRRKYKQRFNENIHVMGDRFSDLEERTTEVHDLYNILSERLEENVEVFHQAQAQLDGLQTRMDETPSKVAVVEPETPALVEAAQAKVKVLEELVAEMTTLRDNAQQTLAEEMQSIRDAREALKSLTEEVHAQAASLKRKRVDEDSRSEGDVLPAPTTDNVAVVADEMVPPPRKRARRVANLLVQTATAVSIGAVVTWSALAFS